LYDRTAQIVESARAQVSRTINTAMVQAYWHIGREIIEVEQKGESRAGYGEGVVKRLAGRLSARFGRGFANSNVKRMRQFYLAFPNGSRIPQQSVGPEKGAAARHQLVNRGGPFFPPLLTWTHYRLLVAVKSPLARNFYEIEAAREGWTTRELERQVASLLYERLAKSRDKNQILALGKEGHSVIHPRDILKDPIVLEFLELDERAHWLEADLEETIIGRLESFLLELGKGFCFVARQKRITLDGDHFYVDLVFYNRLLRCFVLIDLKLGKLTHQDLGQMQMYVNIFDRHHREDHEAPTVGIVLCSDKNDAMVRITLPDDNEQVHASRYQLYLPTEEELRVELEREREVAERALRFAAADEKSDGD